MVKFRPVCIGRTLDFQRVEALIRPSDTTGSVQGDLDLKSYRLKWLKNSTVYNYVGYAVLERLGSSNFRHSKEMFLFEQNLISVDIGDCCSSIKRELSVYCMYPELFIDFDK